MLKEDSIGNSELLGYSDTDFSSFGSVESEGEQEEIWLDNISRQSSDFLKDKTANISHKVLNYDENMHENDQNVDNVQSMNKQTEPNHTKASASQTQAENKQKGVLNDHQKTTL